jgi:hypothetical protein
MAPGRARDELRDRRIILPLLELRSPFPPRWWGDLAERFA